MFPLPLARTSAALCACFLLTAAALRADVTLPAIFSDHAVLQRAAKTLVWGKAAPGERVTVTLGTVATATATAGPDGRWQATLDLHAAPSGPFELVVQGKNRAAAADVLVGEVWLCSGQSNMEWPLTQALDSKREIAESADPSLRQFLVEKKFSPVPLDACVGKWTVAAPETTSGWSACGYFFTRGLRKGLGVPVGFINSTWGGTPIQSWTSNEGSDKDPDLKAGRIKAQEQRLAFENYVPRYQEWQQANGRTDQPKSDPAAFAGRDVDTADWKRVKLPARVSTVGLPAAGAVWVRHERTITPEQAGKGFELFLDGVRETCEVYWNGKKIGTGTLSSTEHRYGVRGNLVEAGKGVLAVRIFSAADGLGIEPGGTRFRYGSNTSLAGEWLAKEEYALPPLDTAPKQPTVPQEPARVSAWLYNGMIAPLIPYGIRGVAWYQGEQNSGAGYQYRTAFAALINDWRGRWGEGNFPFLFCQLPNYNPRQPRPTESVWAELRESQATALKLPNTGQATLIDVGEENNIHPANKQAAGDRLARVAMTNVYGKPTPFSGPVFDGSAVEAGKVRVRFKPMDKGLVAKELPPTYQRMANDPNPVPLVRNSPGGEVEGFAVCGEDKKWKWATAKIEGNAVVVWSDEVPAPVAVRYAWADNPVCNLYNTAGLPAAPFRTDDFPPISLKAKY